MNTLLVPLTYEEEVPNSHERVLILCLEDEEPPKTLPYPENFIDNLLKESHE